MSHRSPEQVQASVEEHRKELGRALERLRAEVQEATDWRKQLRDHQREAILAAAAAGFLLGGGIGGVIGLFRRRS